MRRLPILSLFPDSLRDPSLLWGLVLAAIPLILYLLERRRARPVDWPAMQFLLKDARRTIRWMRLSELLLLILRTAIIALLAYALTRPASRIAGSAPLSRGVTGAVFLIDTSQSMSWKLPSGQSVWEAARDMAVKILNQHKEGDAIWLIPLAGGAAKRSDEEPWRGLADGRAALQAMRLQGGRADVLGGVDLAVDLLATVSVTAREIFIFSDLQASSWSMGEETRWPFVLARLRALVPPPSVVVLAPGGWEEPPQNHALISLQVSQYLAGTDKPVDLVARVGWFGAGDPSSRQLQLFVDDLPVASRALNLSLEGPMEVRLPFRFDAPGFHRVLARLDGDRFAMDDVRHLSLEVVDQVPVLIVAGEGSPGRLEGKGDYLELALSPRAGEETPVETLFRPRVASAKELTSAGVLEAFLSKDGGQNRKKLIVLANVPFLSLPAIEALENFVGAGGNLLIFGGGQVDIQLYNNDLFKGGAGLLPVSISGRKATSREQAITPRKLRLDHPAFHPFKEQNRLELESVRIWQWLDVAAPSSGAAVLGDLSTGSPLLVEKTFGRGRVLFFSISADIEDSELPQKPVFIPLLHGLASLLAQNEAAPKNVDLGDEMRLDLPHRPLEEGSWQATAQYPDGSLKALPIQLREGRGLISENAGGPGFYTFLLRQGGKEESYLFAANLAAEESDLRRLEKPELERITRIFGFSLTSSLERPAGQDAGESRRVEHWPWILGAVLAFAFLEILLTRYLASSHAPCLLKISGPRNSEGSPPE